MPRKNRRAKAAENHERWLITYADLITLLLIFFVVMYAMSKVDMKKYEQLSQALSAQFADNASVLPNSSGILDHLNSPVEPVEPEPSPTPTPDSKEQTAANAREQELQNLLEKVNQYITDNKLGAQVSAGDTVRGVVIKLNDMILFDLGKAELKTASLPILDKLGNLFESLNTKVSIEGHTDNLPLATGSFYKDNWGLSQARSISVVRYFTQKAKLPDQMFVATAYADTVPIAPNDTEANRAKNRRVEIVVLRETAK